MFLLPFIIYDPIHARHHTGFYPALIEDIPASKLIIQDDMEALLAPAPESLTTDNFGCTGSRSDSHGPVFSPEQLASSVVPRHMLPALIANAKICCFILFCTRAGLKCGYSDRGSTFKQIFPMHPKRHAAPYG